MVEAGATGLADARAAFGAGCVLDDLGPAATAGAILSFLQPRLLLPCVLAVPFWGVSEFGCAATLPSVGETTEVPAISFHDGPSPL